ncbi:diguanylate cyclase [Paenibacillus sp. 1P07SE]|uniref:histidine kinase N-terminal 7TM domain-containing diguanylate cyclase n=1 Tax=Paenibacillus sp. 1P07SE TaxID=3132209 RepID=UPI0039A4F1E4
MDSAIQNYIVLVSISGALHVLMVIYALNVKTSFSGIRTFVWMGIFSCIYTFGFAFELASDSLAEAKLWIIIEYLGMPFIAPCCLMLVLHYVNLERYLTRRAICALFAIPVTTSIMVATNDLHHLFYQTIYVREDAPAVLIDIVIGQWYIVHGSFTFACLLAAGLILIRHWKRTYRVQMATILVTLYAPMLGSFIYLLGYTPFQMDPVPIIMSFTSALYIWAILSTGLLRVSPIAREKIFENMRDAVLVLDQDGRIGDFNRSASRLLPGLGDTAVGQSVAILTIPEIEQAMLAPDDPSRPAAQEIRMALHVQDQLRHYQVRISPLPDRSGQPIGHTVVFMDVTEQILLHNKLQHMATTDGLTGLYNRTHFMELGARKLAESVKSNLPFAVILLDIDHFKQINDGYGHDTGDAALQHTAAVCSSLLRSGDLLARYGGEEFVLAIPGADAEDAFMLAERLRRAIQSAPLAVRGDSLTMTASFGVSAYGDDETGLAELIRQADQALYAAKRGGRNRVNAYSRAQSDSLPPSPSSERD